MKKTVKPNYISKEFWMAIILIVAAVLAALFIEHIYWRNTAIIVIFAAAIVYFSVTAWRKQHMVYIAANLLAICGHRLEKYVNAVSIPTAVVSESGRILYHNPAFFMLAGAQCEGRKIDRVFALINTPQKDKLIDINGVSYYKELTKAEFDGKMYWLYRLIDTANSF